MNTCVVTPDFSMKHLVVIEQSMGYSLSRIAHFRKQYIKHRVNISLRLQIPAGQLSHTQTNMR